MRGWGCAGCGRWYAHPHPPNHTHITHTFTHSHTPTPTHPCLPTPPHPHSPEGQLGCLSNLSGDPPDAAGAVPGAWPLLDALVSLDAPCLPHLG